MGKPGFPMLPPAGGFGRASPSQEQPYVHCGVVRRSRMDGYREHRLLTYAHAALTPPPNLPPLGGGAGLPPPSGGRAGEGGRHLARGDATRAGRPRSQAMFIGRCARIAWTANVNIGSRRGVWGNRVSPRPRGRVPEARAPRPRPLGGFGRATPSQEEPFFIPSVCGGAAWTAEVNLGSRRGAWGNRVSPPPRPAGAWGNRVSPCPHPQEGLGGRSPPRKNLFASCSCAAQPHGRLVWYTANNDKDLVALHGRQF